MVKILPKDSKTLSTVNQLLKILNKIAIVTKKRNSPLDKIPQIEMEKSVDVESVTQNFIGQTDTPTNTVSDYMKQENLYSLKNQPIPYKQRLLIQLLQTQAAQKQSVVNFGFNTILIA